MSKRKNFLSIGCTLALCLFVCNLANGDVLVVGQSGQPYSTIQSAVNAAHDGDVIMVEDGTYDEQVVIRNLNDIVIKGDQAEIWVPGGGMTGPLVKIVNCQDFNFTGFVLDGRNGAGVNPGLRNSGGDADTRFYGLFVINSSGQIAKNTIKNMSWYQSGLQQGLGISVIVNDSIPREINIRQNIVTNFQKNGITVWGSVEAKIHKNTVIGWGDTPYIAQNCMQVGGDPDMTASITSNIIKDSNYTGVGWASTGILVLYGNDNVRIVNNTISSTMVGIYVNPVSTNCKIINNSGIDNTYDYYSTEDETKVHANKFEE